MELGVDRLPWYGQIGAFLLLAACALLAFHLAWVSPARLDLARRQLDLDRKRAEIAAARQAAQQRSEVAAQVAALEVRAGPAPDGPAAARDTGALLRRLQALAGASDVVIRAFTPRDAVTHASHEERASRLELAGGFHDVVRFLERAAGLPHAVRIDQLDLRALDPRDPEATVAAACTLTTFAPEPPAPEASGGAQAEWRYEPRGRRDPFGDPPAPGGGGGGVAARPRGLAGVRVGELRLQGLVSTGGRRLAVAEAADARTWVLYGDERLFDGVVKEVTADAVVFTPAGEGAPPGARREVRKGLDGAREGG